MSEWLKQYGGASLPAADYHRRDVPIEHRSKFTFAVVRNPYARVVSMWRLLRKFPPDDLAYIGLPASLDLPVLVQWMAETPHACYWSQVRFLDAARIDRVVRFERLEEDLADLPFVRGWHPISVLNVGERFHAEDLTPEAVRLIDICCAQDFTQFGYALQSTR